MIEGAKRTLEGFTNRLVVAVGDPLTNGLQDKAGTMRVSKDVEYAVCFQSGSVFFTGGFDSAEELSSAIQKGNEISGSYFPGSAPWCQTYLHNEKIESIIDLRVDTAEE